MTELTLGQAQRLTAPAPFALLSTVKEDGTTNFMAISWWTYLSNHPGTIGVSLSHKGLSGSRIAATGEFALSIVSEDVKQAAISCGRCSGRTTDKKTEFAIPTEKASVIAPEVVAGSRVVFECKLVSQAEASDHTFFIAEVVAIHGNPDVKQVFAFDGYARLDTI